ncbi:UNVERIFIED_CONTAM: hypothetical protein RMT77_016273 [Armadillidium vulgare]
MEGTSVVSETSSAVSRCASRKATNCISKVVFGFPCAVSSFCKTVWKEHKTAVIVTVAVIAVIKVRHHLKRKKQRKEWNSAGENVVVLHGFSRATSCPNLSPFVLKLETYMRMSDIQYKVDEKNPIGPKGKCPWITFNGKDYADSQLIMEFLGEKLKKNFSSHLNEEQKAVARAMLIMTEEHILWGLAWWRLVKDPDQRVMDLLKLPFYFGILLKLNKRKFAKSLWVQGIGRHSDEDLVEMIRKDIEALSNYLGKKEFLMGDTPCEVDCAVFGMLSQFVWGTPGSPFAVMVQSEYRNLLHYCIRIQKKFWPDWDNLLLK